MSVNPKFPLVTKHQRLLSATVSANITRYDQKHCIYILVDTGGSTSGLKQSQVFIGAISDRFDWIRPELKKRGANQSDVIKNGLLAYKIDPEQSH